MSCLVCAFHGALQGYGSTQTAGTVVRAGPVQQLEFVEEPAPLPEYDGHHICVYLTVEGEDRGGNGISRVFWFSFFRR